MEGGEMMTTTTVTNFRKNLYAMVENTVQFNEPVNITTKSGNVRLELVDAAEAAAHS